MQGVLPVFFIERMMCKIRRNSRYRSFIDSNPDLWFDLQSSEIRRPRKGVHFASLLVGQPSGQSRPTQYISPSGINMITNRDAFLGMYLLDVWANH
jgi:hypothetical protein